MAFVVETGEGVTNANTYVALAFANAYFVDRNETRWTGTDAAKQGALVVASTYVDSRFEYLGTRLTDEQGLDFPRDEFGEIIPMKFLWAVCQYALLALRNELLPTSVNGRIQREKVGPLEVSYFDNLETFPHHPAIDGLMREFIVAQLALDEATVRQGRTTR